VLVVIAAVGLFVRQYFYIQHHLPLIRAERAVAEREGGAMLEKIGAPPGAVALSKVERSVLGGGVESMWENEPIEVVRTCFWDAQGNHAQIDAWYREKLLADGWQEFRRRVPSTVQSEYFREKWLLAIEHEASFAEEHPPHARFRLRFTWNYWHALNHP
jgi:hypothetical protein